MINFFKEGGFDLDGLFGDTGRSPLEEMEGEAGLSGFQAWTDQERGDACAKLEGFLLMGNRKKYFEICGEIEKQYEEGHGNYFECMSIRARECEKLLKRGDAIYHHYPLEDARGEFEFDYDPVRLWEQVRFGEIVDSEFIGPYERCVYEIDEDNPEYLAYRGQLYENSIRAYCRKYPAAIIAGLPEEERKKLASYLQQAEQAGKEQAGEKEQSRDDGFRLKL